jgi:hypothetical protein
MPRTKSQRVDNFLDNIDLAEKVKQLAMQNFRLDWHHDSRTHICYTKYMRSVKGVGDWPNTAFDNFKDSLEQVVSNSSKKDLEFYIREFAGVV